MAILEGPDPRMATLSLMTVPEFLSTPLCRRIPVAPLIAVIVPVFAISPAPTSELFGALD